VSTVSTTRAFVASEAQSVVMYHLPALRRIGM
jgi:hypothetical protein